MASLRGYFWAALIVLAWCGAHADASSDAARVLSTPDRPAFTVLLEDREEPSFAVVEARSGSYATLWPQGVATAFVAPAPVDSNEVEARGALPYRAPPFTIY